MAMPGLTIAGLRRHPSLIPLFGILGAGVVGAGLYLARLTVQAPDVSVNHKSNQYPWIHKDSTYQYKFIDVMQNYKSQKPAPVRFDGKGDLHVNTKF